jgi:hypothetical protein
MIAIFAIYTQAKHKPLSSRLLPAIATRANTDRGSGYTCALSTEYDGRLVVWQLAEIASFANIFKSQPSEHCDL